MNTTDERRIMCVEIAFGALREIKLYDDFITCGDYERLKKFHAVRETLSRWAHYGQYSEDRIHIYQNEEELPVRIGKWEFWPVIKDIHYWQRSTSAYNSHEITLNGRDSNGKMFEETFVIYGEDLLPGLVYAMILISVTNDIALAMEYWKAFSGRRPLNYSSIGEYLDKVITLKKLCETIVKEHPYMELFLQQGLSIVVEDLKESVAKFDILK